MNDKCSNCDYPFQRESGFYLGAIYFNYGLTALILAISFPILTLSRTLSQNGALFLGLGFAIVFPLLFFRHARSLWLGMDEYIDPYQRQATPDSTPPADRRNQDC